MDVLELAEHQREQLFADTGCSLENLPEVIDVKNRW